MPDYGVAGSTRRYALIVAMLVGLSSVPTLVVFAVGAPSVEDDTTPAVPLLGVPPERPFVVVPGIGADPGRVPAAAPPVPAPYRSPAVTLADRRSPATHSKGHRHSSTARDHSARDRSAGPAAQGTVASRTTSPGDSAGRLASAAGAGATAIVAGHLAAVGPTR